MKIFRNIRQKLASENKVMAYLRYAIGEIVLVVIGILIALQVNNWNENRKSNAELNQITENLKQEFESNHNTLKKVVSSINYTQKGSLEILSIIGRSVNLAKINLDSLIETSLRFPTWTPSNYVLNDLKSSGKLALIKDIRLKELLFKWEKEIKNISDWNRRMEESSRDIVDYIKQNGSLRNIHYKRIHTNKSILKTENNQLFYDVKFENQIDEKALYSQFLKNEYQLADDLIKKILEEINKK